MTSKRSRISYLGNTLGEDVKTTLYSDPLAGYAATNEQLIKQDAILQKVLLFLQMKLFADGIVFVRDGQILIPPDSLQTTINHYWMPFLHKTLPFQFARGYLVFRIYENPKGIMVPDVPDHDMLAVRIGYEKHTASPVVDVQWKDSDYKSNPLYVINNQSPFGVTPANTNAPVDRVKPFLLEYYQLVENKYVANFHNARPPLILQQPIMKAPNDPGGNDLSNFDDNLERKILENMETVGKDDLNLQRIRRVARYENSTYVNKQSPMNSTSLPAPWWIKAYNRQTERPEDNYMYIPHGLSYTAGPSANSESDYVNIQTSLLEKIYNAFGIPYSAILTSSSRQSSTGIELHKTTLINTLKTYWSLYEIILTDVYRLIYDFADGDVDVDTNVKRRRTDEEKEKEKDTEKPEITSENELFKKEKKGLVKVYLKSQFQTTPEQAIALYHEGIVNFDVCQALRLESVGLPMFLADKSVPDPIRTGAMDMATTMKLNENAKAAQANNNNKKN